MVTAALAVFIALATPPQKAAPAADVRWPSVATEVPRQGGGEADVAVVVGVSDYLLLPDIDGAADNARDWAQHLVRVRGLKRDRVTLLTDAEATKERIERAVQTAATQASAQGRLWFIFIGHGAPSPKGDDGLLLGADAQPDADSLAARGTAQRTIEQLVDGGAQRDALVVYDACFSGRSHDGEKPLVANLMATLPVRKAAPPKAKTTVVLSSSESFAGPLPGEARPAFSYLLLGSARGWADDDKVGGVDVDEAFSFVRDTMQASLKASARLPVRRGAQAKLTLAAKATEPAPDVNALVMRRCPEGTRWGGRTCAVVDCPRGTSWNGSACAATTLAVSCPAGTTWNGTTCAASGVACPAGTAWNGTACAASGVSCPSGARWDGARCVADAQPAPAPPPTMTTTTPLPGLPAMPGANMNPDAEMAAVERLAATGQLMLLPEGVQARAEVLFDTGTARVSQSGSQILRVFARELRAAQTPLVVECHSDNRGDAGANVRLTQQRADAVAAALAEGGVARQLIRAVGHGGRMPIAADTDSGVRENRRCLIRVDAPTGWGATPFEIDDGDDFGAEP